MPWDLECLSAAQLAPTDADLAACVARLQAPGSAVPACWHTHGRLVAKLAALAAWRTQAYAPGDAATCWGVGATRLQRAWVPVTVHQGRHPPPDAPWDEPLPVPELAAWVRAPTLILGPPRSGRTRRRLIPNVAAWRAPSPSLPPAAPSSTPCCGAHPSPPR